MGGYKAKMSARITPAPPRNRPVPIYKRTGVAAHMHYAYARPLGRTALTHYYYFLRVCACGHGRAAAARSKPGPFDRSLACQLAAAAVRAVM